MLYYIREYPEQFHHPMEDRFLFAALRSRTDDFDDVLDELQCEHIEGDVRLRNLEHALTRFELKGEAVLLGSGKVRRRPRRHVGAQRFRIA